MSYARELLDKYVEKGIIKDHTNYIPRFILAIVISLAMIFGIVFLAVTAI